MDRRLILSPESAQASEIFDKFCTANTLKGIIFHYRQLCRLLRIKATHFPDFYPRLKAKLCSWRAQGLWTKIEKRASAKCYGRGTACASSRVLIIGAGPCGLRTAIEAQLLGAKVVLIEKRDRLSRNNVLHLWPFVITDLKGLGAKKFYGKFCAGSIDHISIRQLQCLLLKVALLLGVEVHEGVGFEGLSEPTENEGWKAITSPPDHPVSHYHFDSLIGADGRRNTLEGFRRKALRAKLAIAITVNFINKRTEAEARVKEISGVSYIFNQKFFQDLNEATGIDLENIVYYKDETHYFVMTAKKQSLLAKGVLLEDHADTSKLLSPDNISREKLMIYAVEAALFSTENQLPDLEFAVNHYGQPDVAMFDFTAMYAAENASRVVQRKGHKLMMTLVGDSLLEPFWPTGSGCARGFLSSFDACWMLRSWASGTKGILEVIAERESIYRLLGQTTPENLNKEHPGYTTDPHSRYPNLNSRVVMPFQVKSLYDTDEKFPDVLDSALEIHQVERQRPKRRRDSVMAVDSLLSWLRSQVSSYGLEVADVYDAFGRGDVLCAIIYRFRPDLIDFPLLSEENVDPLEIAACRNQVAFDVLQTEYGISPVLTGPDSVQTESLDFLVLVAYLSQIYEVFKGEIPQMKYLRLDGSDEGEEVSHRSSHTHAHHPLKNVRSPTLLVKHNMGGPRREGGGRRPRVSSSTSREGDLNESSVKRHRKRRSEEKSRSSFEDRERRREEIERNRQERERRRMEILIRQRERFLRSMRLLELSERREDVGGEPYEDYTMHLYRQTAPEWEERCKRLEHKLFYSGKEQRCGSGGPGLTEVEKFVPGLARDLEEKLKGSKLEKKPKDLIRAIGKLEKSDWNVQLIEKKIAENKGHGTKKGPGDKVPKWSREAFDDKREAMKRRMEGGEKSGVEKDNVAFEDSMKNLGRRLKEGNTLDVGQRGSNKVSQMAEQIIDKFEKRTKEPDSVKPIVTRPIFEPKKGGSETCHFCDQRVYVVERMTAEGRFFHRNCFRCEYCNTSLRLGNYSFDRDGRYGERFYCTPHFQYIRHFGWKKYDTEEGAPTQPTPAEGETRKNSTVGEEGRRVLLSTPQQLLAQMEDRGTTPERVEFENSLDLASEEELLSEMDEDEWTDRNFGTSQGDNNTSDEASDLSEDDDDEVTPEGVNEEQGKDNCPLQGESSGSDTEVASGESSPDSPSDDEEGEEEEDEGEEEEEEEECGGSTTEIETDSEFAEDPPQSVPGRVPTIIVQEPEQLMTRFFDLHPKTNPPPGHRSGPQPRVNDQPKAHPDPPPSHQVYEELRLVEPEPRVSGTQPRALPRVYAIPKKWVPLPEPRAQDVLAATKANELKKQYLHGGIGTGVGPNPKKPVDPTTQNQFSSVLDMISEQQKRLQPAPKPSPAMQAFLEGTDKLKNHNSRFPTPQVGVTSPRANQLPPWSEKPVDKLTHPPITEISIGEKTDADMNRINTQKSLEAVSGKLGELSPIGTSEKGDAEKSSSPLLTIQGNEMMESCESIGAPFPNSESTTESQQTIVPAEMKRKEEGDGTGTESGGDGDSSGAELTLSDLEADLEHGDQNHAPAHPPRVEVEDEFGVTLALDLVVQEERDKGSGPRVLTSSDSKDSLNSALYLETEMSDWADDGEKRRRRRQSPNPLHRHRHHREDEPLALDFEGLDFVDMDELSSPDEILQSISRKRGYARLFEEEVGGVTTLDEGSGSSLNESSSTTTTTPTLGSLSGGIIQLTRKVTDTDPSKSKGGNLSLHGGVIPFSNALDSLDYRKMKGGVSSPLRQKDLFSMYLPPVPTVEKEVEEDESLPLDESLIRIEDVDTKSPGSPGIARKLDELSKERAKESELIRSMVIGRIRKNRRGSRGSLVHLPEPSSPPPSSASSSSERNEPRGLPMNPSLGHKAAELKSSLIRRQSHPPPSPSPLVKMFESVTNPPTPVNPVASLFSPITPSSDFEELSKLNKSHSPSFYASLPNISLVLGRTPSERARVTKVSSFLSPNPKKWDDSKHLVPSDQQRARELARQRARLKSDEELGLSPKGAWEELKLKLVRRKLSAPDEQVFSSGRFRQYESEPSTPHHPLSPEPRGMSESVQHERFITPGTGRSTQDRVTVGASIRHNVDFPMVKKSTGQGVGGGEIFVAPPLPPPRQQHNHPHQYKRTFSLDSRMGKESKK